MLQRKVPGHRFHQAQVDFRENGGCEREIRKLRYHRRIEWRTYAPLCISQRWQQRQQWQLDESRYAIASCTIHIHGLLLRYGLLGGIFKHGYSKRFQNGRSRGFACRFHSRLTRERVSKTEILLTSSHWYTWVI